MKYLVALFVGLSLLVGGSSLPAQAPAKKCGNGSQIAGALLGGLLGGFAGNRIDGGKRRATGTIIGALGGAFLGSMIAKKLDKCEKDKLDEATVNAVNAPVKAAPQTWTSDSRDGVHGTVTAAAPETTSDGRQCRTVTRVAYISGEEVRETPRLCRTPPSTDWQQAA